MQFQLDKNVPNRYVEESRDFQLLCHVIDIYLNQAIEKTFDMRFSLDPQQCRAELLPLLARRMGFITSMHIPDNVLRAICSVFPTCIKMKGTIYAVRLAAHAILGTDEKITLLSVVKDNNVPERIDIITNVTSANLPYLKEVLRFITPPGIIYSYNFKVKEVKTEIKFIPKYKAGRIRTNTAANAHIISDETLLQETTEWSNEALISTSNIHESFVPTDGAVFQVLPDEGEQREDFQVLSDAVGKLYPQVGFIKIAGSPDDAQPTPITKKEEVTNE